MALRLGPGPGPRRAALGGAGVVALYLAAGVLATSPALRQADTHFLGFGAPREGLVTPGDHLQTAYNLWLPGHQLAAGRAPWRDPYSFQPEAPERTNFAGWPFALLWWPLDLALGTVGAWNALVLLTYVGAGGLCALWLRSLELPRGAALAGGLAFALAPYRVAQSTGHLLGPIAMLLPLALYAVETRRRLLAVAALASIPLAGQVHLALGAIPFALLYAGVRGRLRVGVPAALAAVAAGALVYATAIRGTTGAGSRSFADVERYSAELGDFVSRNVREFEAFVFLGWATPLAAIAGLALLVRVRRHGLALALGLGVLVPAVLALGANTPLYEPLWRHLPGLGHTRVPERLMPIAVLSLAALVAFAVARVPHRLAPLAAVLVLAGDLRVPLYDPLTADEDNRAYAALDAQPAGRVLELPVLLPEAYGASVYLYYAMQAPRERPLGYSTTAPPEAERVARRLRASPCDARLLRELGVRYVVAVGARPCSGTRLGKDGAVTAVTYP